MTSPRREDPVKDSAAKLTERSGAQRQDYHAIRTPARASRAYCDGWERIWGRRKGGNNATR